MDAIRQGKAGDAIVSFFPTTAHLARPSYLELNMANNLLSGFKGAVDFIFQNTTERNRKYKRFIDGLLTVIECHAASNSATVGERYMGLCRVGRDGITPIGFFPKFCTLLESTLLPFVIERYENEQDPTRTVIFTFKWLQGVFAILYLSGFSRYSSFLHFLIGIRIKRSRNEDNQPLSRANQVVSSVIKAFVYSIQLAQWYYSHENILHAGTRKNFEPPQTCRLFSNKQRLADPRLCPLCRRIRQNPTALVTSGEVYCYSCLVDRLRRQHPNEDYTKLIRRLVQGS